MATCASLLALAVPCAAHRQAQRTAPSIRSSTNLVLVDVSVTGKDRKPVRGLTQSDFRLFEDGKPEPIAIFRADYAPAAPPPAPAPLPAFTYTNLPAYHPPNGPLTVSFSTR